MLSAPHTPTQIFWEYPPRGLLSLEVTLFAELLTSSHGKIVGKLLSPNTSNCYQASYALKYGASSSGKLCPYPPAFRLPFIESQWAMTLSWKETFCHKLCRDQALSTDKPSKSYQNFYMLTIAPECLNPS